MTHRLRLRAAAAASLASCALLLGALAPTASAYDPTVNYLINPTAAEQNTQNKQNSILYPKAAELGNGTLVAAFEKSLGNPVGQTIPIYTSTDHGTTWQETSRVPSPAELTRGTDREAEFAKYTSNWTNPYLYVLPQNIGDLRKGTLLLASLVSGQDEHYAEMKAKDSGWVPNDDGDRRDLAIALFASTDGAGKDWTFLDVIAEGGWQANYGDTFSAANAHRQQDPVWEPYLMAYDGKLVCYYTDEVDYTGYDMATGELIADPEWQTRQPDSGNQILAHRTWDGVSGTAWSKPVADEVGTTGSNHNNGSGDYLGANRPGMTNVVPTTDGKWIMTAEFGVLKIADNPLEFWKADKRSTTWIGGLKTFSNPVIVAIPNPDDPSAWSLAFNSGETGGDIYVNASGRSDGTWVRYKTPLGNGYSRNITYVTATGRVALLRSQWGKAKPIQYSEVDLGHSAGAYYQLVNRRTGLVLGTGGRTNDAAYSGNRPDVTAEEAEADGAEDTQFWHLTVREPDGRAVDGASVTLLNKSGGRALGIWQGKAAAGQGLAQWVDDGGGDKVWKLVASKDGYYRLQSQKDTGLYAVAPDGSGAVTLGARASDGSDEWRLVRDPSQVASAVVEGVGDVSTAVGVAPSLPSSVRVTLGGASVEYDDDSVADAAPVSWDAVDPSEYAEAGGFTVRGTARVVLTGVDTTIPVSATVKVTEGTGTSPVDPDEGGGTDPDEDPDKEPGREPNGEPNENKNPGSADNPAQLGDDAGAGDVSSEAERQDAVLESTGSDIAGLVAVAVTAILIGLGMRVLKRRDN